MSGGSASPSVALSTVGAAGVVTASLSVVGVGVPICGVAESPENSFD